MMNEARFSELVSAYGADPARWPLAERAAGLAFVAQHSDTAERVRSDAAALDAVLETARMAPPPAALAERILTAGLTETRFAPSWARMAAVLALSAGLGLGWAGASLDRGVLGDDAYALAFSGFAEPAYEDLTDFLLDEVSR